MQDLVRALKAVSDETRLRILHVLLKRDCCVCEVMQALDISQTRASRNLMILYDAGFLALRKEGLWSLYSVDKSIMTGFLPSLLDAVSKGLEGAEVVQKDRDRLARADRVGPGCVRQSGE